MLFSWLFLGRAFARISISTFPRPLIPLLFQSRHPEMSRQATVIRSCFSLTIPIQISTGNRAGAYLSTNDAQKLAKQDGGSIVGARRSDTYQEAPHVIMEEGRLDPSPQNLSAVHTMCDKFALGNRCLGIMAGSGLLILSSLPRRPFGPQLPRRSRISMADGAKVLYGDINIVA